MSEDVKDADFIEKEQDPHCAEVVRGLQDTIATLEDKLQHASETNATYSRQVRQKDEEIKNLNESLRSVELVLGETRHKLSELRGYVKAAIDSGQIKFDRAKTGGSRHVMSLLSDHVEYSRGFPSRDW